MNSSFLDSAVEIAKEAGGLLAHYYERRVAFELKGEYDLVTEADRASERLVVERLGARFPSHGIIAEEGGGYEGTSEYRWYVDPLDGTTNFAHGYPMFNVTMALERAGEMICGVIHDPLTKEMFTAERGSGAYCNNRRIHVSKAAGLESSLVSTGFPSRRRHLGYNIHFYHQLAMCTHGVRRGGSAALDLAYTACGRLDGFWEFGLNPWDMAAGLLMVEEAGGRISDMKNGPASLRAPHIVADNGLIHEELIELFGSVFRNQPKYPLPSISE